MRYCLKLVVTKNEPQIGTLSKLDGTSFAVLMIDLDIPTDSPPKTDTLVHWAQTGLKQSAAPSNLGGNNAFLLTKGTEAATQAYFAPNPPNKAPVTHRYTQIVIDTTGAAAADVKKLQDAVKAKQKGFDVVSALKAAGLSDKVVAGNFFRVTNGQAAISAGNSTTGGGSNPRPSGVVKGTGGVVSSTPTRTSVPIAGAAHAQASIMALGLGVVAAACWML